MSKYHRYYLPNSSVFITTVTRKREPIFETPANQELFLQVAENVKCLYPFDLDAYVIMPDHVHMLLSLLEGSSNFSVIIHSLKRNFSWEYKKLWNISGSVRIWQERFWDHLIRNETDYERHMDYIHYNPVKHGQVKSPSQWIYSSFNFWVNKEVYPMYWGDDQVPGNLKGAEWG